MLTHEEYAAIVEQAPVLIWRADADGQCDYFNERWLAYRGRTPDQEKGNGWVTGVHPDDLSSCLDTWHSNFRDRKSVV